MAYSSTVSLASNTFVYLTSSAPFTLSIDPSNVSISSKIYRIDYNFGDGVTETQKLSLNTMGGDPIYNTVSHTYYLSGITLSQTFSATVSFYQMGSANPTPTVYNIVLNLNAPTLEGLQGYFSEFHLVGSRMFGPNNTLLYLFESISPNYMIPVIVDWSPAPVVQQVSATPIPPYRPYRLLAPFEVDTHINIGIGSSIKNVDPVGPTTNADSGNPPIGPLKI